MSDHDGVTIFAPGSVGNVGPGLDILGLAIAGAGDTVHVEWHDGEGVRVLDAGHPDAHYHETLEDTRKFLAATLRPGDMLLTMGAGNVYRVGEQLLEDLAVQTPVG